MDFMIVPICPSAAAVSSWRLLFCLEEATAKTHEPVVSLRPVFILDSLIFFARDEKNGVVCS